MNQTTAPGVRSGHTRRRMMWHRQVHQWHWISAAVCLAAIVLFSVTGITLNHASRISAEPQVTTRNAQLPGPLLAQLAGSPVTGNQPLPREFADWVQQALQVSPRGRPAEWSDGEIYLSMPGPGTDAWLTIDRASGAVEYEHTDRGWIAYFNDLHKGRNTGTWWIVFIDIVAAACLLFSLTGLLLLQLQARVRSATWPAVGGGLVLLVVMMVFFLH